MLFSPVKNGNCASEFEFRAQSHHTRADDWMRRACEDVRECWHGAYDRDRKRIRVRCVDYSWMARNNWSKADKLHELFVNWTSVNGGHIICQYNYDGFCETRERSAYNHRVRCPFGPMRCVAVCVHKCHFGIDWMCEWMFDEARSHAFRPSIKLSLIRLIKCDCSVQFEHCTGTQWRKGRTNETHNSPLLKANRAQNARKKPNISVHVD